MPNSDQDQCTICAHLEPSPIFEVCGYHNVCEYCETFFNTENSFDDTTLFCSDECKTKYEILIEECVMCFDIYYLVRLTCGNCKCTNRGQEFNEIVKEYEEFNKMTAYQKLSPV